SIFVLTDKRNAGLVGKLAPLLIGATVGILISLFAPLTQGGWNPARDFGPRIVSYFAGWESIAIPGPSEGFWIYILGPLIGAPVGAAVYHFLLKPALGQGSDDES
ncbi:MAG: aquaporin, partial [Dehalococcoidia bacterium]|nr:aquaporin [Dehalococcoidia bacterium]